MQYKEKYLQMSAWIGADVSNDPTHGEESQRHHGGVDNPASSGGGLQDLPHGIDQLVVQSAREWRRSPGPCHGREEVHHWEKDSLQLLVGHPPKVGGGKAGHNTTLWIQHSACIG